MNKSEIINEISKSMQTKTDAVKFVNALFRIIKKKLQSKEKVVISGFGSFWPVVRKPRIMKNPKTGKITALPSRERILFKLSRSFFK